MFDRLRKSLAGAELPDQPVVIELPDARFGGFTVTGRWDPRVVTVTGPWPAVVTLSAPTDLPEALKRRLVRLVPPPRITPMTRDAVLLHVDGRPAPLDCGRRALRRATYTVRATVAGRQYALVHEGRRRARLHRDGRPVAWLSTRDRGATVSARYEPTADAADATVGVALGMTLGVGAPGLVGNLLAGLL
jgi:hypothetical protein